MLSIGEICFARAIRLPEEEHKVTHRRPFDFSLTEVFYKVQRQ